MAADRNGEAVVLDPDEIASETDPLGVGAGDAPRGIYVLLFEVESAARIDVGALGSAEFPAGAYAYVGSAYGSNGLCRIDRHRRVADGAHDVRHWHVDYLGGHSATSLASVLAVPEADVECPLATALRETVGGRGVEVPLGGFGASDCDCPAHLVAGADPDSLGDATVEAVERVVPSRG